MNLDIGPHQVVLISGKQGSGKSSLADNLRTAIYQRKIKGLFPHRLNFADVIYEMHDSILGLMKFHGVKLPHEEKDGDLLQLLGTDWGRNKIGPDVWVQVAQSKVKKIIEMRNYESAKHVFIFGDCRFENEVKSFQNALTVRLACPVKERKARVSMWRENQMHASEISLDAFALSGQFDFNFVTASGFDSIEHCTELLIAEILKR